MCATRASRTTVRTQPAVFHAPPWPSLLSSAPCIRLRPRPASAQTTASLCSQKRSTCGESGNLHKHTHTQTPESPVWLLLRGEDAKTRLVAHHSQQQGSAHIQVGSPSKKQRINHQHGRQQPGHSTRRPGVEQRSEAVQAKTVAPPFFIFCFVGEFDENINAGMQIVKLKSNCTQQLRGA